MTSMTEKEELVAKAIAYGHYNRKYLRNYTEKARKEHLEYLVNTTWKNWLYDARVVLSVLHSLEDKPLTL